MSHEEGSCYCCLQTDGHPADVQKRPWKDVTERPSASRWRTSWSSQSRLCESHKKHSCHLFCLTFFCSFPSLPLSPIEWAAEAAGLRQRVTEECEVLLWVSTSLHSSDFYCLEFVFSQRSLKSTAYPLCSVQNTHIHTNRCNLNVNWCECSALASRQRHQWISK